MHTRIVMIKLGSPILQKGEDDACRQDCVKTKSRHLINRLSKKNITSNPFHISIYKPYSYKKYWFCKQCYHIFNLKPVRKFKTLQEYKLVCPKCKSGNTAHSESLAQAIIGKLPQRELLKISAEGSGIEVVVTGKTKYIPEWKEKKLNSKNMKTFTIKPCDVIEAESVQFLYKRFEEKRKLYICTGKEKVGKTALVIKLLNALSTNPLIKYKPVIISFDDTMGYWHTKLKQDDIIFPFNSKRKVEAKDIIIYVEKHLLHSDANFIVLDGINSYVGKWPKESFITLLGLLVDIIKKYGVNIFVTYRGDTQCFSYPVSSWASRSDLIEAWYLERPEFFENEFGETMLGIH